MKRYLIIVLSLITLSAHAAFSNRDTEQKEVQALQLINLVGRYSNDRFTSESEKGDSREAYYEFLARFESLKVDHISGLNSAQFNQNAKGFDLLIKDIQKFLK